MNRRDVLKAVGAILMTGASGMPTAAAAAPLESAAPESLGFAPDLAERFAKLQAAGRLSNVHGVVALRNGRIIFERYLAGTDEIGGIPTGMTEFKADTLHDLRDVTKSIVGLLYGIALGQRRVPAPDELLMAQFPEYPDLARDPGKARLTIAHALTMTLALDWNEEVAWERSDEAAMERAPDRYRFVLDRPTLGAPGKGFIYCGGATYLLARLIERGTGTDLHGFAKSTLFEPLGIGTSEWTKAGDGIVSATAGLRLMPRDLARIGQMIVARGQWDGRTVVPADWLEESFRPAAMVDDARHYGYHWNLGETALPGTTGIYGAKWGGAFGLGGQRLYVFPELDFVLAVTAGNYAAPDQWRPPYLILREVFLASLTT
jgi:CubicO group peptidase (beta-lactamase class C family)